MSIIRILNFYCSQISCRRMPKVIQRPGSSWWRWLTFCWISSSPRMIETRKCSISIIPPTWCVSWTSKFPILVWLFNNFSSIVRPPWSTKSKQVSFTFIFLLINLHWNLKIKKKLILLLYIRIKLIDVPNYEKKKKK